MRARDNPFAVERLHGLRFRGADVPAAWGRAADHRISALVGAQGSGKTTLLLELAAHARYLGYRTVWIQLRRDARRLTAAHRADLAAIDALDVVCVDGADLLPLRDRWFLERHTRHAVAVIGTLHGPGWMPTLVSLNTSPALLDEIVGELTGSSVAAIAGDRGALYARHHGNLRSALRELYDVVGR